MNQKKDVAKQPARIPPPLTFDHMFNIYLNPEFIKKLSGKGKQWLSRAMVNMLVVDKSIHHSELSYLEDAIGMAETEEEREELKKAVKEHNQLELGNLDTDRDYAGHFFYYLAMNVAADGKIKKSEVYYLLQICGKLGFPRILRKRSCAGRSNWSNSVMNASRWWQDSDTSVRCMPGTELSC